MKGTESGLVTSGSIVLFACKVLKSNKRVLFGKLILLNNSVNDIFQAGSNELSPLFQTGSNRNHILFKSVYNLL